MNLTLDLLGQKPDVFYRIRYKLLTLFPKQEYKC